MNWIQFRTLGTGLNSEIQELDSIPNFRNWTQLRTTAYSKRPVFVVRLAELQASKVRSPSRLGIFISLPGVNVKSEYTTPCKDDIRNY